MLEMHVCVLSSHRGADSSSLWRRYHVRGQTLRRIHSFHFLLNQVHRQTELLFGEFAGTLSVCQRPVDQNNKLWVTLGIRGHFTLWSKLDWLTICVPGRSEAAESSWRYPSLHLLQPSHQNQSQPVQRSPRTALGLPLAPPSDQRTPARINIGSVWNSIQLICACYVNFLYASAKTVSDTLSHNVRKIAFMHITAWKSWDGGVSVKTRQMQWMQHLH